AGGGGGGAIGGGGHAGGPRGRGRSTEPVVTQPSTVTSAPVALDPAQHPGVVASPMVGTAYLASEPGARPFVEVGASVKTGEPLMIIEAMKTMNQIPAPRPGTALHI